MLGGSVRELCIEQVGPMFRIHTGTCLVTVNPVVGSL
jgi:hypothetical protein